MQFSFFDIQQEIRKPRRVLQSSPINNSLPSKTGPLSLLSGKDVLVITDNQNLNTTAKELGCKMSWRKLGSLLDDVCQNVYRHSILAHRPDDNRRIEYLTERGWIPHATIFRTVKTRRGLKQKGNADMLMTFWGGLLVSRSQADIVLIGSGDGDLVQEMAIGIRSLPTSRTIVTIGFKSSTANRLYARKSDLIDDNIFIGLDCLHLINKLIPVVKAVA